MFGWSSATVTAFAAGSVGRARRTAPTPPTTSTSAAAAASARPLRWIAAAATSAEVETTRNPTPYEPNHAAVWIQTRMAVEGLRGQVPGKPAVDVRPRVLDREPENGNDRQPERASRAGRRRRPPTRRWPATARGSAARIAELRGPRGPSTGRRSRDDVDDPRDRHAPVRRSPKSDPGDEARATASPPSQRHDPRHEREGSQERPARTAGTRARTARRRARRRPASASARSARLAAVIPSDARDPCPSREGTRFLVAPPSRPASSPGEAPDRPSRREAAPPRRGTRTGRTARRRRGGSRAPPPPRGIARRRRAGRTRRRGGSRATAAGTGRS